MSEQTPNSSEDLSGAEPSMEDILASIRKIISDDEPMAMESPEDVSDVNLGETSAHNDLDNLMQEIELDSNDLTSDAVLDAAAVQADDFSSDGDSVDLNIDDVLAGLDDDVLEFGSDEATAFETEVSELDGASSSTQDNVQNGDVSESLSELLNTEDLVPAPDLIESDGIIPDVDEDILAFLDEDIPLTDEGPLQAKDMMTEMSSPIEFAGTAETDTSAVDDLEMDALLDDILTDPDEAEATDMSGETDFNTELPGVDVSSDLDLVKSLIADLADDPDGLETEEDLDALLAIPDVEDEPAADVEIAAQDVEIEAVEPAEPEEDILGDILDMTLEDELQSHPEDIQADDLVSLDDVLEAEQENIAENALETEDALATDAEIDDLPSLIEIAAAAEADAVAVETAQAPQTLAAGAGIAALVSGAAIGATALDASAAETETTATHSELSPEPITNQETSMPVKAVKTDAILDDVTETAAAGAFAELNQVVEDKAIFNERGPRIGDLVQEALRPMLKEWLDANLKGIVERAVTKEVKRISSGK
ncbi:MAG: DUF2497 domain-containing protein [Litorimonas sp.]